MQTMLSQAQRQQFADEFRRRLAHVEELPALPEAAMELLALRNHPQADVKDLVSIISRDPGVSAQVLRYGRLSIFGYGERIQTVENAVTLVLGYEKALYLTLGLAVGNSLTMQADGPLGRRAFWRHSFTSAILCQNLAQAMPKQQQPNADMAYLSGLLHDIGSMLIGYLYPREFAMLNALVERYYDQEPRELELLSLGISHDMIGLHLMRTWNMPEELLVAIGEHHFPEYGGKHSAYCKLVYLSNYLQRQMRQPGLAVEERRYVMVRQYLGLDEESVEAAVRMMNQATAEIGQLSEDMAA